MLLFLQSLDSNTDEAYSLFIKKSVGLEKLKRWQVGMYKPMFAFCMSNPNRKPQKPPPKPKRPNPRPIRLPLPPEVILRINKYMSSPSCIKYACLPVSTRDWDDYEKRLVIYKKYKFFCYEHHLRPILFPTDWASNMCQIFLEIVPYM